LKPRSLGIEHPSALAMFQAAVARAPERDLIRYFDTPLTVARVDAMSGAFAEALSELGVERGDRVALYLQNVPQFVIALLAIWKLGAIAVPCNPMLRERELGDQLRDCGATVLVTLESLYRDIVVNIGETDVRHVVTTSELDLLDQGPPQVLAGSVRGHPADTSDMLELITAHDGANPEPPELGSDDPAILTYTSGTTGPPKGAINTHGNLVFVSEVYRDALNVGGNDVILGIAPLFHITGITAHIGLGLSVPAPIVLAYRFDAAETCRLIERHRATITVATITAYLAIGRDDAIKRHDISSLHKAYSGGAPIPPAVVEDLRRRTGIAIRSVYGLTETTGPTHVTPLDRQPPVDPSSGAFAAGMPVVNTTVRILGDDGEPVAAMELGEVALTGPQVVPGYWNKPEETAHAIRDGELRTGDIGKVDEEGWLFVVDRKKDLIVAGGYKVWPTEVEGVLFEHPAVHEAAVVGAPDEYRGETVQAFVSLKPGHSAEAAELVAFCRERMAAYKYPRIVEILEELPKTASGKILRRKLRERAADSQT
jgi:long-chain acyl-CoA synthetase